MNSKYVTDLLNAAQVMREAGYDLTAFNVEACATRMQRMEEYIQECEQVVEELDADLNHALETGGSLSSEEGYIPDGAI